MYPQPTAPGTVVATTLEVLPHFGLAFVEDDASRIWGITRSMPGPGLADLGVGRAVVLRIQIHPGFSVVQSYDVAR